MTLRELHARLGQMIADRDGAGMGASNDQPVLIRVWRTRRNRPQIRNFPVKYASGAIHVGETFGAAIEANEWEEVTP